MNTSSINTGSEGALAYRAPVTARAGDNKPAFDPATEKQGKTETGKAPTSEKAIKSGAASENWLAKTAAGIGDMAVNAGGILSVASLACPLLEPLSAGVNVIAAARQLSKGDTAGALSSLASAIPGGSALGMAVKTASKVVESASTAQALVDDVKSGNGIGAIKDGAMLVASVAGAGGKFAQLAKTADKLKMGAEVVETGLATASTVTDALKTGNVAGALKSGAQGAGSIAGSVGHTKAGKIAGHIEKAATVVEHGQMTLQAVKEAHSSGDKIGVAKALAQGTSRVADTVGHAKFSTIAGHIENGVTALEHGHTAIQTAKGLHETGDTVGAAKALTEGAGNVAGTVGHTKIAMVAGHAGNVLDSVGEAKTAADGGNITDAIRHTAAAGTKTASALGHTKGQAATETAGELADHADTIKDHLGSGDLIAAAQEAGAGARKVVDTFKLLTSKSESSAEATPVTTARARRNVTPQTPAAPRLITSGLKPALKLLPAAA